MEMGVQKAETHDPLIRSKILVTDLARRFHLHATAPGERRQGGLFDLGQLCNRPRVENEAHIRSLCQSAYLGGGTALCRVLGRYKLFADTTDVGLTPHLLLDGYWEMWLTEALAEVLKPGMRALDVGANLGYFSLIMADRVGSHGHVHAFEPNPPIAARLRQTLAINGFGQNSTVHQVALSDADCDEALLVCPPGEPKNAYLVAAGSVPRGPNIVGLPTRRLDGFTTIGDPDVVKIDADTAEYAIWHGMAGLFDTRRPMTVFLEFALARYARPTAFLADIQKAGFSLARLELEGGIRSVRVDDIICQPDTVDQMLVLRR